MVFLLIFIFICIVLYEVPDMARNGYWHELKIYSIFLIASFIVSLFYIIGLPVPNPVKGMEYVVKDILHINYK